MPINLDEAIGAELPPAEFSWTSSDIQLYHLGLGAVRIRWTSGNCAT